MKSGNSKSNLIVIKGPTCVGKTSTAIQVAKYYDTEIISADSRQIYSELSIGTAVPSKEELETVKHHFIKHVSIFSYYNASIFENEAIKTIHQLFKEKEFVVLTGGSGLYIDAVCKGIDDLPEIEPELRQKLIQRLNEEGVESLRKELKIIDPDYYGKVDLKNPKRILKALEISIMTGKPYSSFLTRKPKERNFNIVSICLNRNREELYQRINNRVEMMFSNGLVDEARSVYPYRHLNALNTVGYKELFDYFEGKYTLNEAVDLIQRNTRKYARKQLTWFRKDPSAIWLHPDEAKEKIRRILSTL